MGSLPSSLASSLYQVTRAEMVVAMVRVLGVGEGSLQRFNPWSEQCLSYRGGGSGVCGGRITGWWREFWRVACCTCGLCSPWFGWCGKHCAVLAQSRCLPGAGGSCVWAWAQQVWGSWRLDQDVHTVPHRPSSRPHGRPCVAAFHLSDSV